MAYQSAVTLVEFRKMLKEMLSNENLERRVAEENYFKLSAMDRNYLLFNIINDAASPIDEIEMAAVLLRRLVVVEFEEFYSKLAPETLNQMKNQFFILLHQHANVQLKKKIGEVAAEFARNLIDEHGANHWPEFLNFLFDGASSKDVNLRETVLFMFSLVPGVFGNQQGKYISVICQMLSQTLMDQHSPKVRYAAAKALTSFMLANEKESQVQKLLVEVQCDIYLLKFFEENLESKDAEPDEILRSLVDLAEVCPHFFRSQIDNLLFLCWKGVSDKEHLDSTRQLSLEVFVTICESAPPMIRKSGSRHIPSLVLSTLEMMTELEEDPKWDYSEDDNVDEESDSNSTVAESALDRLACALGGKALLPLIMNAVQQMLSSGDWKGRYAGLMAISAIGEGCLKQMSTILPKVVEGVLQFLYDESSTRVRYAACNALGQMSTDFAPSFQKKFHEKVITSLLALLGDPSSPRVQAHAGAALVNFFEDCPKNIISPYLNKIVLQLKSVLSSKLIELTEKGTKLVLEQVVVTLASLADSAQEKFVEYYDVFMLDLKLIIKHANLPNLLLLRGKTIECVSLIGLAVGREKFYPDASEVMELLLNSQTANTTISDDDPQLSYMITAWARICKILGKEFEPYLKFVMGPVLNAASLKPKIAVLDSEEMKSVGNDEEWEFVNLGEKHNFGIRTAGLDDKATACQMLVCYAKELKEGFAQYVEETVQLMIPMLKFYFHDGVRIAAAEILPCLLDSAKVKGESYVQNMWRFILPPLLQALESEPEPEVLCEHMSSFSQCIEVLNCDCLSEEDMKLLINILIKYLELHFNRNVDRENEKNEDDYDEAAEEELEEQNDEDFLILSKISEIVCTLFATYKVEFFACFDTMLLQYFVKLLESKNWQDRQWSLCVFADIIEYTGPVCYYAHSKYKELFLPSIKAALDSEICDLRQTSAYAVGVLAQHGGPEFYEFCAQEALPLLIKMINSADSRSEENERATENAISSVTKIFMSNNPSVSAEKIIPVWITWLPIWDDEEEVQYVINVLCNLLETNNTSLLSDGRCNIPRVVHIFADAFFREAIEPSSEVGKRIVTLVRDIQINAEMFSICLSHLTPDHQNALHKALSL